MNTENREHVRRETSAHRNFLGVGLALLLATAAFFSGVHVGGGTLQQRSMEAGLFSFLFAQPEAAKTTDLSEFWKVWELLEEKYVSASSSDSITAEEKIYGAIGGLVDSYNDPYTIFLPPGDANMFAEDISGNFGGVGMEVGLREGLVTVIAPLPDTPAAQAGIVAGDVIVEIDGASTEDMGIDEAVRLIRGDVGTTVALKLYREGETELLEKSIERAEITIPTIDTEVRGDVFIISLYNFNALAEEMMAEALQEYVESDATKLIIDVRGNPGGFLQSAVAIASHFVPAGKTVVRESFGEGMEEELYRSTGHTLGEAMPEEMLVLVDEGSASASEILAGALQEHGIAQLLGEQTYGKGSVQELISLNDGSSLKVTVARWFTPDGTSISQGGLTPDILVERTPQQVVDGIDPQLEAALAWMAGDKTVGSTTASAW